MATDFVADVLAHFTALADDLTSDAEAMESYGATATAKAIAEVRSRIVLRIADVRAQYETLTVDQYASLHGASPTSVKRWIASGELAAEQTAGGYKIRRSALRRARQRSSLSRTA